MPRYPRVRALRNPWRTHNDEVDYAMNTFSHWCRLLAAAAVLLPLHGTDASGEADRREARAHEHGHGLMTVAVDGKDLVIELELPAVNVVGFEHAPETDEQRRRVDDALDTFGRGDALFVPAAAAACSVEHVDVKLAGMSLEGEEAHAHGSKGEAHSDLHGEYHFRCERPGELGSLEVRVFDHLRDVEELDVQIVTPTVQTAKEIRAGSAIIGLGLD